MQLLVLSVTISCSIKFFLVQLIGNGLMEVYSNLLYTSIQGHDIRMLWRWIKA